MEGKHINNYWIHCNKCTGRPQPNILFYASECGHIFCQKCASYIKLTRTCVICRKEAGIVALSEGLDPTIQAYFQSLENCLDVLNKVYHFQATQQYLFSQNLMRKYTHMKTMLIKMHKEIQMLRANPVAHSTPYGTAMQGANFSGSSINITPIPGLAHRVVEKTGFCDGSASAASREYRRRFPNSRETHRSVFTTVFNKFRENFSVHVWCGIIDNLLIEPVILPNQLTGSVYLKFVRNTLPPPLSIAVRNRMIIQHDGVPVHYYHKVGRGGPIHWSPKSPELDEVYKDIINTEDELL